MKNVVLLSLLALFIQIPFALSEEEAIPEGNTDGVYREIVDSCESGPESGIIPCIESGWENKLVSNASGQMRTRVRAILADFITFICRRDNIPNTYSIHVLRPELLKWVSLSDTELTKELQTTYKNNREGKFAHDVAREECINNLHYYDNMDACMDKEIPCYTNRLIKAALGDFWGSYNIKKGELISPNPSFYACPGGV